MVRVAPLLEAVTVSVLVTGLVLLLARLFPLSQVATAVGAAFLVVTWALVWRKDDRTVLGAGLALGGIVLPRHVGAITVLRATMTALAWALLLAALTFPLFFIGYRIWFQKTGPFALHMTWRGFVENAFGQLLLVALPEEAFYRGYLQTAFDRAFPRKIRVIGARVGIGVLASSAIFALGHVVTLPVVSRLSVFFPSLLFGWLRARTRGIGAGCAYHAMCNVVSEALSRGFAG